MFVILLLVLIYGNCEGDNTVWAVVSKSPPPPLMVVLLYELFFIRFFENSNSLDTEEKNYLELFLKVRPIAASTRLLALSMSIFCWLTEFVGEFLKVSNCVWFGELLVPKFVKFNCRECLAYINGEDGISASIVYLIFYFSETSTLFNFILILKLKTRHPNLNSMGKHHSQPLKVEDNYNLD